ncbi:MAG TPA: toll/interleukin-1 receptor domain-containing protein [Ktedonobacteraceae bacterium]|nr:toll/interleukin-1 receptor domain-containing protein [Ktedonobacteraceae bacterium]
MNAIIDKIDIAKLVTGIMTPKTTLKVFYSYSHIDQDYRNQLEDHLSGLIRHYNLQVWGDSQSVAGNDREEVPEKLNTADLIFLLISPDFRKSKYCSDKEMTRALERHARGEAKVIPILIRHVHWPYPPFSHIRLLPTNSKPVKGWRDRDEVWSKIAFEVEKVIQDLLTPRITKEDKPDVSFSYQKTVPIPSSSIINTSSLSEQAQEVLNPLITIPLSPITNTSSKSIKKQVNKNILIVFFALLIATSTIISIFKLFNYISLTTTPNTMSPSIAGQWSSEDKSETWNLTQLDNVISGEGFVQILSGVGYSESISGSIHNNTISLIASLAQDIKYPVAISICRRYTFILSINSREMKGYSSDCSNNNKNSANFTRTV